MNPLYKILGLYLLLTLLINHFLFIFKLRNFMNKTDFLAFVADIKSEIGVVSTKVEALEQKINNSPTDVDPDIVAAVQDLKGSVDTLNAKADNTPAAGTPPATPAS